jgi:hypothetical protein
VCKALFFFFYWVCNGAYKKEAKKGGCEELRRAKPGAPPARLCRLRDPLTCTWPRPAELGAGDDVEVDGDKSGESAGGEGSDGNGFRWVSEWVFTRMRNL